MAGPAPYNRQMQYEAYDPALDGVLLWGGYNGYGANYEFSDSWEYSHGLWTDLNLTGGPTARAAGGFVYDAADHYMLFFGGRNNSQEFNDTWTYSSTGWSNLSVRHAPSPRDGFGIVFDTAANEVVLFGGRSGNLPPGEGYPDTFYNDTWTYRAGVWTNITATAGRAPPAAYRLGQMAYDASDGYILLTGGVNQNEGTCGLNQGTVWTFSGGRWSESAPTSPSPPTGRGSLWFDNETNTTYYYESEENLSVFACTNYNNEVWSYTAGAWTEVTSGGLGAPLPRVDVSVVDDLADDQQLLFGGGGQVYAQYFGDTWVFFPGGNAPQFYNVTFEPSTFSGFGFWDVTFSGATQSALANQSIQFGVPNGSYSFSIQAPYDYRAVPDTGTVLVAGAGQVFRITFVEVTYSLTFEESGLPAGKAWSVEVAPAGGNGSGTQTLESTSPEITFELGNGTYDYLIHSEGAYRVYGLPPAGTLYVFGETSVLGVGFARGSTVTLTVHEEGLLRGTSWCVDLGALATCSVSDKVVVPHLTPGLYNYSIPGFYPFTTSVSLRGVPLGSYGALSLARSATVQVRFDLIVSFVAIGLPFGTFWGVEVGRTIESGIGSTVQFELTNGTYTFHVLPVTGYQSTVRSARFAVVGSSFEIYLSFVPVG
ncbi:MAG: kelch repeat-containing protein [Thermoplasmata archaeon]